MVLAAVGASQLLTTLTFIKRIREDKQSPEVGTDFLCCEVSVRLEGTVVHAGCLKTMLKANACASTARIKDQGLSDTQKRGY